MAAAESTALKAGNGHVNGHAATNGKLDAQRRRSRRDRKRRQGFVSWTVNAILRLATYFSIFTILFRCPGSLEECDETTPFICKYHYQIEGAIKPVLQPYYEHYTAPYVEIARPYYDTVNTHVIQPAKGYAVQYGAPWVEKAQEYGLAQWEKNGQPHLQKLQDVTRSHYDQSVAPYVSQAGELVGPYYEIARTNTLQLYYEHAQPGYKLAQPYIRRSYDVASEFTGKTALPAAYWAWDKTYTFLDTTVWPQLRIAYLENVEPQLVRIGERLGRYRNKVQSKASSPSAGEGYSVDSSVKKPTSQQSTATTATTATVEATPSVEAASSNDGDDDFLAPVQAPPAAENETEKRRKAREMVAEDLELWQNKFAQQADEGAQDMEDRVDEIAKVMISESAHVTGKQLVDKFEDSVKSETESLKQKISAIIEQTEDPEQAESEAIQAVRSAGVAIKEQAQAIRKWRQSYDSSLHQQVVQAADVHFQILDETRALALQKIGMKWAWADGVTYKDWAKYHELKKTLNDWTNQLKDLIVTHPALLEAQEASALVEDESMEIASSAAQELARIKEVAHLKVVAKDATDNFELEAMELAAKTAQKAADAARKAADEAAKAEAAAIKRAQEAASVVSETFVEATEAASDLYDDATSTVADAVNEAGHAVYDQASSVAAHAEEEASPVANAAGNAASEASGYASSAVSKGTEAAGEVVSSISSSVADIVGEASGLASDDEDALGSVFDAVISSAEDIASAVEESVINATDDAASVVSEASESASSVLSDASSILSEAASSSTQASEAEDDEAAAAATAFASEASEVLVGQTEQIVGNVSDFFDDDDDKPADVLENKEVPEEAASVKPAMFGAMAQAVPERKPILDNYVDPDDASTIRERAEAAYSNAVAAAAEQYSSAASVVSAQIYGTPKPVHEQLFSSVSGAYDKAVAAASSRFNAAIAPVATTTAPEPTALLDWSKVESIANQRLNEARLWAEIQYQSATMALGLATPTPTSTTEKFYAQAKLNYLAGLGNAQERYSSFIAAASSAMSSLTATPTPTDLVGTASSMASVARESAASVINAAEGAAESAYSAAAENVAAVVDAVDGTVQSVIDAASEQVYLTGVTISEAWDNVLGELNAQIYSEPSQQIGWYESLFKDAAAAGSAATEAVVDKAAGLTAAAEDSAETASAEAARQYSAVTDLISELVHGKEPSFTESVRSRLNAVYATAAANLESYASDASEAASSVRDRVGSAASKATDAVKESLLHDRDEL